MKKRVFIATFCAFVILSVCLLPVSGNRASAADKIELQVYSNPFGHTTYVLSFALAEIINKNSSRLHATCMESKGSAANILYLQGKST